MWSIGEHLPLALTVRFRPYPHDLVRLGSAQLVLMGLRNRPERSSKEHFLAINSDSIEHQQKVTRRKVSIAKFGDP